MPYAYIWKYRIDPAQEDAFLGAYAPGGRWVELFRKAEGYRRTELLRDRREPGVYVTVDYWESAEAWERFRSGYAAEFEAMDSECEGYTLDETEIGRFEVIGA